MSNPEYPKWFKPKGYVHLMPKITYDDFEATQRFVKNPNKVAKYTFFPLIHRLVKQRKYKKLPHPTCASLTYRSHFDIKKWKPNTKERDIYYANHLDSQIYSYYSHSLQEKYDEILKNKINIGLSECITAYRDIKRSDVLGKGKSNIHFAQDVFEHISNKYLSTQQPCTALAFDIEQFFSSLNHAYLKKTWAFLCGNESGKLACDQFNIFKSLTRFWYVEENDLLHEFGFSKIEDRKKRRDLLRKHCCKSPNELNRIRKKAQKGRIKKKFNSFFKKANDFKRVVCGTQNKRKTSLLKPYLGYNTCPLKSKGIPQGTPISAFLANLYLLEFDKAVYKEVNILDGFYRRYSDDIIVICSPSNASHLKEFVEKKIKEYHLTINSNKTEEVQFNSNLEDVAKPLRYLGLEFDGEKILIKSASLAKYHRRMKAMIKRKVRKMSIVFKATGKEQKLWTNQIRKKYTSLGKSNFITYVQRASSYLKSSDVSKQVKKHRFQLEKYITKKLRKN